MAACAHIHTHTHDCFAFFRHRSWWIWSADDAEPDMCCGPQPLELRNLMVSDEVPRYRGQQARALVKVFERSNLQVVCVCVCNVPAWGKQAHVRGDTESNISSLPQTACRSRLDDPGVPAPNSLSDVYRAVYAVVRPEPRRSRRAVITDHPCLRLAHCGDPPGNVQPPPDRR